MFAKIARNVSNAVGTPYACIAAVLLIIVWLFSGPFMRYSETWMLLVNTITTIITFIMIFIIQNTQNSDTDALHRKIDELIRVTDARDEFIAIEKLEVEVNDCSPSL